MRKFLALVVILILQIPLLGIGQSFYSKRKDRQIALNVGSGITRYYGDLVSDGDLGKVKPNINFGAEYFMKPRISIRADLTWFQLSGSDAKTHQTRNLSFTSNSFEFNVGGAIQLFADDQNYIKRHSFNLYGVLSAGLLYFNPTTIYEGEKVALQPLQTEGVNYSRVQFVIPMGIGARFKINPFINFAIEGIYRETFTDYLDDVSSFYYPDPATLNGGVNGLSAQLSDRRVGDIVYDPNNPGRRGDPTNQDSYFIITAKIQYFIASSIGSKNKLYTVKRKSYYKKGKGGLFKRRR